MSLPILSSRALYEDEIRAVLGFKDSGLIDWGFTEDDLPARVVTRPHAVPTFSSLLAAS